MASRVKNGIALALVPQFVLVKWLGNHPDLVETYYSNGLYPHISQFFRTLLGWIPFSVGDLAYSILIVAALYYLVKKRWHIRHRFRAFLRDVAMVVSIAYFSFHLLWGLNYYRLPIHEKLGISNTYTQDELVALTERLVAETNALQLQLARDSSKAVAIPASKKGIFTKTIAGYGRLEHSFPFLGYANPSLKKSLLSRMLTYMGYSGYLNPFTNEAQVNALIPKFSFPVVAGHEIGHQIGYSAENETNLIGYMVTAQNQDPYLRYTAYAFALRYCLAELQQKDEARFEALLSGVNQGVRENYAELRRFWDSYENPMEPVFKSIYDTFLQANDQEEGIKSYRSVVGLLVNYHKKYPL